MNALKRIIVLGFVFFIGFSFVAFGKITYHGTATEILNFTINNRKTAKTNLEHFISKNKPSISLKYPKTQISISTVAVINRGRE